MVYSRKELHVGSDLRSDYHKNPTDTHRTLLYVKERSPPPTLDTHPDCPRPVCSATSTDRGSDRVSPTGPPRVNEGDDSRVRRHDRPRRVRPHRDLGPTETGNGVVTLGRTPYQEASSKGVNEPHSGRDRTPKRGLET